MRTAWSQPGRQLGGRRALGPSAAEGLDFGVLSCGDGRGGGGENRWQLDLSLGAWRDGDATKGSGKMEEMGTGRGPGPLLPGRASGYLFSFQDPAPGDPPPPPAGCCPCDPAKPYASSHAVL